MKNKGSYIKLAIKTAVGAVLGGILGLVVLGTKVAHMGKEMKGLESWIGAQAHWIFLLLFLLSPAESPVLQVLQLPPLPLSTLLSSLPTEAA